MMAHHFQPHCVHAHFAVEFVAQLQIAISIQ
jgi:hypothetical protein